VLQFEKPQFKGKVWETKGKSKIKILVNTLMMYHHKNLPILSRGENKETFFSVSD